MHLRGGTQLTGTIGPDVVDIRKFYGETGLFTYDPGFTSTGSCQSSITFIDGDKGELLYRGYSIDELAEILTLVQTGKPRRIPIILVGSAFWSGLLDWFRDTLVSAGTIDGDDMALMQVCDEPEEIVRAIFQHYETRSLEPSEAEQEILLEL